MENPHGGGVPMAKEPFPHSAVTQDGGELTLTLPEEDGVFSTRLQSSVDLYLVLS